MFQKCCSKIFGIAMPSCATSSMTLIYGRLRNGCSLGSSSSVANGQPFKLVWMIRVMLSELLIVFFMKWTIVSFFKNDNNWLLEMINFTYQKNMTEPKKHCNQLERISQVWKTVTHNAAQTCKIPDDNANSRCSCWGARPTLLPHRQSQFQQFGRLFEYLTNIPNSYDCSQLRLKIFKTNTT